jgi:hypothetical protein
LNKYYTGDACYYDTAGIRKLYEYNPSKNFYGLAMNGWSWYTCRFKFTILFHLKVHDFCSVQVYQGIFLTPANELLFLYIISSAYLFFRSSWPSWQGRGREREVWGLIPQAVMRRNLGQVSNPTLPLATQLLWVPGARIQCWINMCECVHVSAPCHGG